MIDWLYTARMCLVWGALVTAFGWLVVGLCAIEQIFDDPKGAALAAGGWALLCNIVSAAFALAFCVVWWANQ